MWITQRAQRGEERKGDLLTSEVLDYKGGASTRSGCGLRLAEVADVAGWNADFLSLQSLVFSLKMRHSEAEGAEARSLRSALREWGSFGRGFVLLDGKGGGSLSS